VSENASGQLLGYALQFPRALCHLLKASPGCKVCIEVHGDVATISPSGHIAAEEAKSSVQSNPVTDKSTDLWKTFSNWVNGVREGEFDVSTTTFVLYRNRSGRPGLAEAFHACTTKEQVDQVLLNMESKFADVDDSHAIWPYYKNVVLDHPNTLAGVITRFQLETGNGAGYDDVELELRMKYVPSSQIPTVATYLNGWVVKSATTLISQHLPAILTFEEFEREFMVLFSRARCLELLDFTTHAPVSDEEIQNQIRSRPTYLRQVEFVRADDDDLIEAVTDFLKAKTNRDKWIEDELIDEDLAGEFESNLRRFWRNKRKEVNLANKELTKEDRGMLLLSQCQTHKETIRNVNPPPSTIAGTYHALADRPSLGWHEDWEAKFKK
jgi:hypothetical protein